MRYNQALPPRGSAGELTGVMVTPAPVQCMTGRRYNVAIAALGAALTALIMSGPVGADAAPSKAKLGADEARFNKRPTAGLALAISDGWLSRERIGRAINWAERAAACPDAKPPHLRKVQRLRAKLKWDLTDQGFGLVKLNVSPAGANVRIDGVLFRPASGHYSIWLPAGTHQLKVALADHKTADRVITAARREQRSVNIVLSITRKPRLELEVFPRNATVWIDNARAGSVAKKRIYLEPGARLVEIKAPGHDPWTRTMRLKLGDIIPVRITLTRIVPDKREHKLASNVKRKLNAYELNRGGERNKFGTAKRRKDPAAVRVERPGGGGTVSPPAGDDKSSGPGAAPAKSNVDEVEAEDDEDDEDSGSTSGGTDDDSGTSGFGVDSGVSESGGESGGSTAGGANVGKGMALTIGGLLVAAGGTGWTMKNIDDANYANNLKMGHKDYEAYYAQVQQLTYASWGVIAAGGLMTGVGSYFLLADGGLSRGGKSKLMVVSGLVIGGAGGFLMFDSATKVEELTAASGTKDLRTAAELDGLYATYQAGTIAAAVGGLAAAFGLYLGFTGGGSSTAAADVPGDSLWSNASLTPVFGPRQSGAQFSLRF